VPADVGFATKPKLATSMIARAIAASVPFKWVAGDTVYGVGDIEQQLRRAGRGYVLGVNSAHVFRSWGKRLPVTGTAADIARTRRSSDWKRLSAGAGTKGPRLHDWCYLELADLEAEQTNSANQGLWTRGLLIRRRIADGDLAFFTRWSPSKAIGGRSRTVSRPRKTNSASITTRADPGMAGIVTFPWLCSPSPPGVQLQHPSRRTERMPFTGSLRKASRQRQRSFHARNDKRSVSLSSGPSIRRRRQSSGPCGTKSSPGA